MRNECFYDVQFLSMKEWNKQCVQFRQKYVIFYISMKGFYRQRDIFANLLSDPENPLIWSN